MKNDYLASDEEKKIYFKRPNASPMSLDDLQGLFYLAALGLGFSVIGFLGECFYKLFFVKNPANYGTQSVN